MINQQLLDYIRQQLATGVARENIKAALMSQGWSNQDITEGFQALTLNTPATPTPPTPVPTITPPITPVQRQETTLIANESMPTHVRYFEWLMYGSILVSVAASFLQYAQYISSSVLLSTFAITGFTVLLRVLCVWVAAHRRANWARWLLLVLVLLSVPGLLGGFIGFGLGMFGGYAGSSSNPLSGVLNLVQIGLQIAALCFAFTASANKWFSPQQVTESGTLSGTTVNTIWTKGIPRTNVGFGVVSLLLVFGLDLMIIISSPDLKPFWYMMLGVLAVFAVFFCLENFVFSKKFADTTASVDKGISVVVVLRNLLFILNFIPFIQLLGLAAIVYVGWILGIIYIGLIVARFSQTKKMG